jgi:hypothetical protein
MSETLNMFAASARHNWSELVRVTRQVRPENIEKSAKALAFASGQSAQGVREKMQAIRWLLDQGRSEEYIIGAGQHKTIHEYREARAEKRLDPQVSMSWRVTADLRYHVQCEVIRISKILGIRDQETFWMFMHAEMSSWTPEQLRHSAGIPRLRRHAQRISEAQRQVDHAPKTE